MRASILKRDKGARRPSVQQHALAQDAFPEQVIAGLAPHAVEQAWLFASTTASVYVDITATFDRKISARLAHASQTKDAVAVRAAWHQRATDIGARLDLALAECFTVLKL